MLFKQLQLFQLTSRFTASHDEIIKKLEAFGFTPCLPSMFSGLGWVAPVDEEGAPMIRQLNGCIMLCLQIEEKILPATVIRQTLNDKIKAIENSEQRKVRQKEKMALKDEVMMSLLPRAFSKFTRIHAYIDTRNNWLVIGNTNSKKTEQFINFFKKSLSDQVQPLPLKKISPILTHWLKEKSYPSSFAVEKTCVLQDAAQQNRIIRCQQQDLFAQSIQALIKDGCEVKKLALLWQDQLSFVMSDDFTLQAIRFQDTAQAEDLEAETKQQHFDANFIIMSETFGHLLTDLLDHFTKPTDPTAAEKLKEMSKTTQTA